MADYDKVIPPGKEGKIIATIKTGRLRRKIAKSIRVQTHDPKSERIVLRLGGEVIPMVDIQPTDRIKVDIQKGEDWDKEFIIKPAVKEPFLIKSLKTKDYINAKLTPPPAGEDGKGDVREYKLRVSFNDDVPAARISDAIIMSTNLREMPMLTVRVYGYVRGPITYLPQRLYFNRLREDDALSQTQYVDLELSDKTKGGFKVLEAAATPDFFKTNIEELEKGKKYRVHVTYKGDYAEPIIRGNLVVKTDNPVQDTIEMIIGGRIISEEAQKNLDRMVQEKMGSRATGGKVIEKIPAP